MKTEKRIVINALADNSGHFSADFMVTKIETNVTRADIVLTKEINNHYKNLKDWIDTNTSLRQGSFMDKGLKRGFRVLFYGPSGTGKTLTAAVLAKETNKEVYAIDLSKVISKYIGDTEKNLDRLFAKAEEKDWILFIDEADALFGKRTNVGDAHDRYANQEVSYLLQKIENYHGLVIVASKMKSNIEHAFTRRFNEIIKFPARKKKERTES